VYPPGYNRKDLAYSGEHCCQLSLTMSQMAPIFRALFLGLSVQCSALYGEQDAIWDAESVSVEDDGGLRNLIRGE
jgi:hypothetical protein